MFEYANHLKRAGHDITIYYSLNCPFHKTSVPYLFRYVYFKLFVPPKWFRLEIGVHKKVISNVNNKDIAAGDVLLFTWWALAYAVRNLSPSKGIKFNLIQDIEFWTGHEDKVKESYFFKGINNVVISEHIRKYIQTLGATEVAKVPFAIDHNRFFISVPVGNRNPFSVCMMYSDEPRKGSSYGIQALKALKRKYPRLIITIFSVYDKGADIDFEVNFYKRPQNLSALLNDSALFLSPSIQEGCALPPMEAMHCGCALICSDIEGHSEYAFNNKTALLFKSRQVEDLIEKVSFLLEHDNVRQAIAKGGNEFIRRNTWEFSTHKLVDVFKQKTGSAVESPVID